MVERGTQVVVLEREPLRPRETGIEPLAVRQLREPEVVLGVPAAHRVALPALLEELTRVLADRLQHPIAVVAATEKALVDQGRDRIDVGSADLLSRLKRGPAGEDCELRERPLLDRQQELVAPRYGRAQRPLALRRRARASGQ